MMEDLTGRVFGNYTVLAFSEKRKGNPYYLCKCKCGKVTAVNGYNLIYGKSKGCGCEHKSLRITHGASYSRLYKIHRGMLQRCNNPKNKRYYEYGARGIKICEEWDGAAGYVAFQEWALANGYNDTLSIDRIDNNKGYSPENCRWATHLEQANNTVRNHYIEFNNEKHTITEWSRILGLAPSTIHTRLTRGWPIEKALAPIEEQYKYLSNR